MSFYVVHADISMKMSLLNFSLLSELFFIFIFSAIDCLNKESHVAASSANILLDLLPKL